MSFLSELRGLASAPDVTLDVGLRLSPRPISASVLQRCLKRSLDIIVSVICLLGLLPVAVFIAVAIVIESPGPVFFRCTRVGQRGKKFAMLKFRKMRGDVLGPPLTTEADPRYTRIGHWLTKTKLDELPQLWNVLCGQMSLVGPRPEDPLFVAERGEDYERILAAKQGITGLSQLAFFREASILDPEDPLGDYRARVLPQKINLDQLYVENATVWWDLRILLWTVFGCTTRSPVAVHRSTGALGFRHR